MNKQLNLFGEEDKEQAIVNVSSVPQRSPFRYPGGKTWLIPIVRRWLKQENKLVTELIEPFAGGGIVSLTAAFENLAKDIIMVEKDEEIAAVWEIILNGNNQWLADKIISFNLTADNVQSELNRNDMQLRDLAFATILRNRISHGGIMAKGSGMIKNGEKGKGLLSRWYPKTLYERIVAINYIKEKIRFIKGDAFDVLNENVNNGVAYFFVDPPYTIAGKRLYTHYEIDHNKLFKTISSLKGHFMLTYDNTEEIRDLAKSYGMPYKLVPMATTHHIEKMEIIVSDNFDWWNEPS